MERIKVEVLASLSPACELTPTLYLKHYFITLAWRVRVCVCVCVCVHETHSNAVTELCSANQRFVYILQCMTEALVRRWLAYRHFLLRMRTGTVAQLWVEFLTGWLCETLARWWWATAAETSCFFSSYVFIPSGTTGKFNSNRNVYYQRSRFLSSNKEYIYFLDTNRIFLSETVLH